MDKRVYKISYLTKEFYRNFTEDKFPEILHKENRPYLVFIVKVENNTFAIPFRTNVTHQYSYRFKNTDKATDTSTGLDFSKAVIVNENLYIGNDASIDKKEFIELENKVYFIIKKFSNYVKNYIRYTKDKNTEMLDKKYKFSSLQYFNKELGI